MLSLFRLCVTGDTRIVDATVIFLFSLRVLDPRSRSARDSRLVSELYVTVRISRKDCNHFELLLNEIKFEIKLFI